MSKQKIDRSNERIVLFTGMYDSMKRFLSVEQFGLLFIAIHEYYINGTEPDDDNPCAFAFSIYKNQFRLNDGRSETSAINGAGGGRPKKPTENLNNLNEKIGSEKEPKKPAFMNNEQRTMNNEQLKDETQTRNENGDFGVGEVKIEDIGGFAAQTEAFIQAFGSAGNRFKTESAYKNAVIRLKMDGKTEKQAHEFLIDQASKDHRFCIQIKRRRRDPDKWLNDGDWSKDYAQELKNFKSSQEDKTAKGGLGNGNTTRKQQQQDYAEAARQHARNSGL